jgi:DNA-directed RNA polymerase subunit delta
MALKRIIKDYKTITQEHIDLINHHFPNGFENDHLISFVTPKGEFIKALEIRTEDTIYLFKIDKNMKVVDEETSDSDGLPMGEFDSFKGDNDDSDDDDEEEDTSNESEDRDANEDED